MARPAELTGQREDEAGTLPGFLRRRQTAPNSLILPVVAALRAAAGAEALVARLAPAPDFDADAVAGRLVSDPAGWASRSCW